MLLKGKFGRVGKFHTFNFPLLRLALLLFCCVLGRSSILNVDGVVTDPVGTVAPIQYLTSEPV
jgi:hypothetical protein